MEILKKNKKMIIIAFVVIAISLGAYFFFFKDKEKNGETARESSKETARESSKETGGGASQEVDKYEGKFIRGSDNSVHKIVNGYKIHWTKVAAGQDDKVWAESIRVPDAVMAKYPLSS
jgi:uncharacterized protein YpmB